MAKTISSDSWNALSEKEVIIYKNNLATLRKMRKEFLKAHPEFKYAQIFTEPQAGGNCRSKFWGVRTDMATMRKYVLWLVQHYADCLVGIKWNSYYNVTNLTLIVNQ